MTPEDLIKAKEEASSVPYQSFVLMTGTFSKDLFCFVEGKDAPYYHFRIKSEYNGAAHYIICGGKKNVIKTRELIEKHKGYKSFKTSYFIDRDFDISLKACDNKLYETPCYSIENLYCSPESFKEILKCEFQLLESDNEFQNIFQLYSKLIHDFSEAVLLFNAWYSLQKQKSRELKIPNNVNLDSTLPKGFVSISLEKINCNYDLEKIKSKFDQSLDVSVEEVTIRSNELREKELYRELRGKYMFNFLVSFIRLIISDANTKGKQNILSKKVKFNVDQNTALSTFSAYAETPECLKVFIKNLN